MGKCNPCGSYNKEGRTLFAVIPRYLNQKERIRNGAPNYIHSENRSDFQNKLLESDLVWLRGTRNSTHLALPLVCLILAKGKSVILFLLKRNDIWIVFKSNITCYPVVDIFTSI